jgi:hypothetical protein
MQVKHRAGLLVLLSAGTALWWWQHHRAEVMQTQAKPASTNSTPGTTQTNTLDDLLAKSLRIPEIAQASERNAPYSLNVCGRAPVLVLPEQDEDPAQIQQLHASIEPALQAVWQRMRTSGDDATRAIGLTALALDADSVQALATLAQQTKDPLAYKIALDKCQRFAGVEPCQALHPKQLTELDPDNADSWLMLAHHEMNARQPEAAAAAFAQRLNTHIQLSSGQSVEQLVAEQQPCAGRGLEVFRRHLLEHGLVQA